ncbi:SPE-39 protein [Aphelenchoides avenae]|nr:SPE-39 protein [Aphelenchus avenae]
MDAHRKFTFDDPEDSYWNEQNAATSTSFFADVNSNASIARQALDELFDTRDSSSSLIDDTASSVAESEKPRSELEAEFEHARVSTSTTTASLPSGTPKRSVPPKPPSDVVSISEMSIGERRATLSDAYVAVAERSFRAVGSASVISDCSVGSYSSEATVHLDYARLKSEHRKLQRHLEHVRQERFQPVGVAEAVKRLRNCEPIALDFYRSKQQKMDLLDAALHSLDHSVIISVLLFLKRTLVTTLFREVLVMKSDAASHYVAYLKEAGDAQELTDTLFSLGRSEEAAMTEFSLACRKRQPAEKVQALKKCRISGFSDAALSGQAHHVADFINLLERQIPIDAADEEEAKSGRNDVFRQFPKKVSLVGQSLLTTLYYCCLYHYDLPGNAYASPHSLRAVFSVSEKEFAYTAISALSRRKRFEEIEKLLTSRKLLTGSRLVCPFPWSAFFTLIAKYGTPPKEVLHKWLRAVPDLVERQRIAEQFKEAGEVQIEALVALKDRQKLSALANRLDPHTVEYNKARLALSNSAYKWKN